MPGERDIIQTAEEAELASVGVSANQASGNDEGMSAYQSLMLSCFEGRLDDVKHLLQNDLKDAFLPLCTHDAYGRMPLHLAAWQGHLDVVKFLLSNGAPWHAQDQEGLTPAQYALLPDDGGDDGDGDGEGGVYRDVYEELVDAACRAELILGAAESVKRRDSEKYLKGDVKYGDDGDGELIDDDDNGVMMQWEGPLMAKHAEAMFEESQSEDCRPDVLNVGFGLGLVDTALQKLNPKSHTIIEAHPQVYEKMVRDGWTKREGVRVVFGRWQDVLPKLGKYDAIMFDTFGEHYADLKEFHEVLPSLLRSGGIYTFFNGLAATNTYFHDVYCRLAKLELQRLGFKVRYDVMEMGMDTDVHRDETWDGIKRRYWTLKEYRLPVAKLRRELDPVADGDGKEKK